MDLKPLRRVGAGAIQWKNVVLLTRLASPHRTSRGASCKLRIHCDSADDTSVAVAGVGSPRILSIRKTPWSRSSCPKESAFSVTEGRRRCFMRRILNL